MNKRFSSYLPVTLVSVSAFLVRLVYNLTVAQGYIPEFDAHFYNDIAIHLAAAHCYCLQGSLPDVSRAPLWPWTIAAIYTVTGIHNFYPRLFLCFLGAGTCILTYLLARDIFSRRSALLAGMLAALYPGLFIYDGWLYSESVFTFFVLGFTYALYRLQRGPHIGWMIACGLSLACASLTRPNGISLLIIVVIWAGVMLRTRTLSWRQATQIVLTISALSAILIAPWTLRNYNETHQVVLIATGMGTVLAGAYNDAAATSHYYDYPGLWLPASQTRPPLTDTSDAGRGASASRWIRTHLSALPYLFYLHFINMWRPYTPEGGLPVREFPTRLSSRILWPLMNLTPVIVIFLAACGLAVTLRSKWQALLVPLLVIGLTIALCIILYGSARFRAPIEPLLVLLTTGAIWWLTSTAPGTWRHALARNRHRLTLPSSRPEATASCQS
ncbi:MAG TPA: glycosyltransferase family 39 protein [Ktedonobacteraceae bacterium]|jgi:4-amino-4-deoxy-L-arabinose transferase-like glycosyltransferase